MRDESSRSLRERVISKLGGYSSVLIWYRAKRPRWLWKLTSPFGRPTSRYVAENGLAIKRGPFQGLEFPERSLGHTNYLAAKIAGVYEPPVVDFLVREAGHHDLLVELGSGDGFFLTGVGRVAPELELIGYEVNPYEQELASEIAARNEVDFEPRGLATVDELAALPEGRLLVLSDIEGFEEELLDPTAVPRLREATIIAEVHEQLRPNLTSTLEKRFGQTHEVTWIPSTGPDPSELPELKGWSGKDVEIVTHDGHRNNEGWMTFVPRSGTDQTLPEPDESRSG